jgi:hypothetical protein
VPVFDLLEEAFDLLFVEVGFLEERADRGQVEAAGLLALFEELLQTRVD